MLKTFTIALASAALIGEQAFADASDLTLVSGSTWHVSEIIDQMKSEDHKGMEVNVLDSVTIIADMLQPAEESYTMNIQGAVTLCFNDFYGSVKPDPNSELFLVRGLTFGDEARLTVEFSEGMVDYIMSNYSYSGGAMTFQALIFTALDDNIPQDIAMTLGETTINLLQSKGISTNESGQFADLTAEGQGGLCAWDNYLYFFAGKPAAVPSTPEPATATLSLLALVGLASRRKRK